jgi:hypothetical protein
VHELCFALPDHEIPPSKLFQLGLLSYVAALVADEFRHPIARTCFGDSSVNTIVLVPEAAMYKYYLASPGKYEIGASWQMIDMKPVPVAHIVRSSAHNHFGLHVFAANAAHVFAAPPFGNGVSHPSRG